ncbi:MAG: hypothetical protein GY841_13700 [FCB group bacterium]|nr:hypothetical protein [FCB group bacterium]
MARLCYKSKNLNRRFSRAARIIADKISKIDGVVGIVATGGIGRGYSDEFSDLDLIVYAEQEKAKEIDSYIAIGQLLYKGIQYDTPVESYRKALRHKTPSVYWSQALRWTLESSIILYDTDDRIADLIAARVIYPEVERKKMVTDYRHWTDEILNYMYPTWKARGQVYNLAHLLRQAAENMILWIYAQNGVFQPYTRKWLFYYLENGLVPEAGYFPRIKKAFTSSLATMADVHTMRAELLTLCDQLGMGIRPISWEEVLVINAGNWKKASEKTRQNLSW